MREVPVRGDADGEPSVAAEGSAEGTQERIIEAAVTVLRAVGHGHFSVQKVAREAGVYQGNITYYWPRRRDLERALAVRVVEGYRRTFLSRVAALDDPPEGLAVAILRELVSDALSEDRIRLLPELWSMANGDPDIARVVTETFDALEQAFLVVLGVSPDDACADEVRRSLALAGAAAQGLTAIRGHRRAVDTTVEELARSLVDLHAPALQRALDRCGG